MRIIVIGANGAVGKAAVDALASRHEIITVGRSSGDIQANIENVNGIRAMYQQAGKVDMRGINHKVLPQVNLVLEGFDYLNDGGSFTLTSGVLNRDPIPGGSSAAAANGALDGFVLGAAVDMPRGIRINAVSPEVLEVSREKYDGFFRGHVHVSNEAVGLAYSKAVEGCLTGQVFIVD
jgi:NAD(P)-dependent dehydrogenase (short-subunit alcohol dehydrogenase family)